EAGSHQGKGWETFTDAVIKTLSDEKAGIIFLLWGRFAQDKASLIDSSKHHILKASHPSPFSAYNGFFGCQHFSKTNELLAKQGKRGINWGID
ncbi:MAG: uracil-DNA glycosylase family protein, partial [Bacteroidia bacterium]